MAPMILLPPESTSGALVSYSSSPIWRGDVRHHRAVERTSIQEIVDGLVELHELPPEILPLLRIEIEGELVPREYWGRVRPKAGKLVTGWIAPTGGGGTGKIIGTIVLAVAMIALAVVSYGTLAPLAATALGFAATGTAATMIGAGITLIGSMAIMAIYQAVMPRPGLGGTHQGGARNNPTSSPSYFLSTGRNTAKPEESCPRVYGRHKVVPNYAALPYVVSRGDHNDLYMLFDFGYGPLILEDMRLGDTPLSVYGDRITTVIHDNFVAGNQLQQYTNTVKQQSLNVELTTAFFGVQSADNTTKVVLDFLFPRGLVDIDEKTGDWNNKQVDMEVHWRATDADAWTAFTERPFDISPPAWSGSMTNLMRVRRNTTDGFMVSLQVTMASARAWQFRVRRTNDQSTSHYSSDTVSLVNVSSIDLTPPIAPAKPHTIVEMRVTSSQELQGSLDRFTAIATSILPIPHGDGTYHTAATRNPAWVFLDVLRGTVANRPLPEERIDIYGLMAWASFCDRIDDATGETSCLCDFVLDYNATTWALLTSIAGTGRAAPTIRDGMKISIAVDDPNQLYPVQTFTPRNSSNFSANRLYIDFPHAIRAKFIDPDSEWTFRPRTVYADGYNADGSGGLKRATLFEDLETFGLTRASQVFRDTRYQMAQARLRPEIYTLTAGIDNLRCTRGDLVKLQHDVSMMGGKACRLSYVRAVDASSMELGLDEAVPTEAGDVLCWRGQHFEIQDVDILDAPDGVTLLVPTMNAVAGDLVVIGKPVTVTHECLVKSITPAADKTAVLELVDHAPAIYTSDTEEIPPYDPGISIPPTAPPGAVSRVTLGEVIYFVGRYPYAEINVAWQHGSGPAAAGFNLYMQQTGEWVLVAVARKSPFGLRHDFRLAAEGASWSGGARAGPWVGETVCVLVQPVGVDGGTLPLSVQTSACIKLIGDTTPPPAPAALHSNHRDSTIWLTWEMPDVPDIALYHIRYSPDVNAAWEDMTVLADNVPYNKTVLEVPARGGVYAIKSMDTSGNRSVEAAYTEVILDWLPNFNVVEVIDESATWPGRKSQVKVDNDGYLRLYSESLDGAGADFSAFFSGLLGPAPIPPPTGVINGILGTGS